MPKNYNKKNIEKRAFVEYYSNKGLETFINDMEKVCKTSKSLHILEHTYENLKLGVWAMRAQDIAQKRVKYILNLPIGKKVKSILIKAADNISQRKKFQESYKNTVLVLEEVMQNYKELCEKAIIYEIFQQKSLY
ncbi:MAG: hypothetical protein KKF74_04980 [Nanoarchaeota archaeon]|nr:hypothetical protein [Nanoarchaeota archaeon]